MTVISVVLIWRVPQGVCWPPTATAAADDMCHTPRSFAPVTCIWPARHRGCPASCATAPPAPCCLSQCSTAASGHTSSSHYALHRPGRCTVLCQMHAVLHSTTSKATYTSCTQHQQHQQHHCFICLLTPCSSLQATCMGIQTEPYKGNTSTVLLHRQHRLNSTMPAQTLCRRLCCCHGLAAMHAPLQSTAH